MPAIAALTPTSRRRALRAALSAALALVLIWSLAFLYRSPYSASSLETVPDSVEYAVAAWRLATLGGLNIAINGRAYPSRYPPGFSLLLAPAYTLAPGSLGIGILVVLGFALVGVGAAIAIGRRAGGLWGGVGAALALLLFKQYRDMSRLVMTDVPAAACGLAGCAIYLRLRRRSHALDELCAGLLSALALALRVDMAAVALPFVLLMAQRRRWWGVARVVAPMLAVLAATAMYNQAVFGDWRRNGYHYWTAVPYDYPWLVWSPRYIHANLNSLLAKQALLALAIGGVGVWVLRRTRPNLLRRTLLYLCLAAGPGSVAHLFYFSTGLRFYLLPLSIWTLLGGAGLAALLPARIRSRSWTVSLLLALALPAWAPVHKLFHILPARRVVADRLARSTPADAVIVTGLDPVYFTALVRGGSARTDVPTSRDVEYASKVVTLRRIAHPVPAPMLGHPRSPGMFRGGARDVIAWTAEGHPRNLLAYALSGRPIYLDLSFAGPGWPTPALRQLFRFQPVAGAPGLMRLLPRPPTPKSPGS